MIHSFQTILVLSRKDFLRRRRSPLGVLASLSFPLLLSGMLAFVFNGTGDLPRARLLYQDRDGGVAGQLVLTLLAADELSDLIEVVKVGEEGRAMIERGEASALLRVPAGTTDRLADGEAVTFELIRNPEEALLPEIAEQITAILTDVLSLAARTFHDQLEELDPGDVEAIDELSEAELGKLGSALWHVLATAAQYVATPPIGFERVELGDQDGDEDDDATAYAIGIFLFVLPGLSVYALFVIGDQIMRDLLSEGPTGTLRRQLSAPLRAGHVVAAKVLVTAAVATIALLLLAAIAAAMKTGPVDPAGFLVLSLALVLAITGCSALIYGLVTTERQGSVVAGIVYLVMAFAGGSFLPLSRLPESVRAVAPLSPFYWGTQGFQDLLLSEAGLLDVLGHVAVLGGLGLTLLIAGSVFLHRKLQRGILT